MLTILKDSLTPLAVIKKLVDSPNLADKILMDYEDKYRNKFGDADVQFVMKGVDVMEEEGKNKKLSI